LDTTSDANGGEVIALGEAGEDGAVITTPLLEPETERFDDDDDRAATAAAVAAAADVDGVVRVEGGICWLTPIPTPFIAEADEGAPTAEAEVDGGTGDDNAGFTVAA
jgi:hypothetical protein